MQVTDQIGITSLTPDRLAMLLSSACRRRITAEQVLEIALRGNLVSASGSISLISFSAYLASGVHREDGPAETQASGPDTNP